MPRKIPTFRAEAERSGARFTGPGTTGGYTRPFLQEGTPPATVSSKLSGSSPFA